jgi:tetratricopeptide (TPR) repeat protein
MAAWSAERSGTLRAPVAALVAALVFALHPAQTEAVTYIAGRSVSLSACLYLGAMLAWERERDGTGFPLRSLLLFALAVSARETALTLPAALALRELASGSSWRGAVSRTRWHWLVLAALGIAIAALPSYRRLFAVSLDLRDPLANLALLPGAIAYLVTGPLLSLRLNLDPDVVLAAPPGPAWWLASLALLASVAVALRLLRTRPVAGFAILWFLLQLLPMHGPLARLDPVNDRQLYLAMAGPALLVGAGVAAVHPRWLARVAGGAIALLLAAATMARNADYRSEVRLWEATARVSPAKARVWNNLGFAYREAGEPAKARAAFERALSLDPAHYKARENLRDLDRARP